MANVWYPMAMKALGEAKKDMEKMIMMVQELIA